MPGFWLALRKQPPSNYPGDNYYNHLTDCRGPRQHHNGRYYCQGGPGAVRAQVFGHAPDGEGHNRHRGDLQASKPAGVGNVSYGRDSVGKEDERGGGPTHTEGTGATVALSIAKGADIVRVHDVKEMVRVARMSDAIVRGWTPDG